MALVTCISNRVVNGPRFTEQLFESNKKDTTFFALAKLYSESGDAILASKQFAPLLASKLYYHLFLDKIDPSPKLSAYQHIKYLEGNLNTLAYLSILGCLNGVKEDPRLGDPTKRVIQQWEEKAGAFLSYASIFDGAPNHSYLKCWGLIPERVSLPSAYLLRLFANKSEAIEVLAKQTIYDLQTLSIGDYLPLPLGAKWHSTQLEIVKNEDGTSTIYHYDTSKSQKDTVWKFSLSSEDLEDSEFWKEMYTFALNAADMKKQDALLSSKGKGEALGSAVYLRNMQLRGTCSFQCRLAMLRKQCIDAYDDPLEGLAQYKLLKALMRKYLIENPEADVDSEVFALSQTKAQISDRYILWSDPSKFDFFRDLYVNVLRKHDSRFTDLNESIEKVRQLSPFSALNFLHRHVVETISSKRFTTMELQTFWKEEAFPEEMNSVLMQCLENCKYTEALEAFVQRELAWSSSSLGRTASAFYNYLPAHMKPFAEKHLNSSLETEEGKDLLTTYVKMISPEKVVQLLEKLSARYTLKLRDSLILFGHLGLHLAIHDAFKEALSKDRGAVALQLMHFFHHFNDDITQKNAFKWLKKAPSLHHISHEDLFGFLEDRTNSFSNLTESIEALLLTKNG